MRSVLVQLVARVLLAPIAMVAAAFLVKGYAAVGDGFAAGLIAALGAIIYLLAYGPGVGALRRIGPGTGERLAVAGLALVLAIAAQALVRGEELLTHWPPPETEPAKLGTLEAVTALGFDLGVFLLVLGGAIGAIEVVARLSYAEGRR